MDGLQKRVKAVFEESGQFDAPPASFKFVEIFKYEKQAPLFRRKDVQGRDLIERALNISRPPESTTRPPTFSFQLIKIDRNNSGGLRIDKNDFQELLQVCKIEPYILYMVSRRLSGYQHFKFTPPGVTHEIDSFYLYWPSGMALWSYDAILRTTQAICIPRQSNTIREGGEIFSHIALIANEQQNLIDNAWFLQMIFASDLATWIDEVLLRERWNIRSIEGSTGHGTFLPVEGPPDLKELMKSSRTIGFSVSALANVMRQNDLAVELLQIDEILESLPATHATATCMRAAPSFATTTPGQAAEDNFKQAILLLRSQMIARKRDVQYLQERARNQSSVLFSLISQKDTEASLDIASAAKDDSESMKVIAVMTMFFLPGGF